MKITDKCLKCGKTLMNRPGAALSAWLFRLPECQCEISDARASVSNEVANLTKDDGTVDLVGKTILNRYKVLSLLGRRRNG